VLQSEAVAAGGLTGEKGRKSKKPHVKFRGYSKRLALNKTNGKTISRLYGKDTAEWEGEWISLYATTVEYDGEVRDCIRIRPERPRSSDGQSQRGSQRNAPSRTGRVDPALPPNGRGGPSAQSKAERDAAEVSAVTSRYLCGEYEKVLGATGSEERMAALKVERGRAWETMSAADREAVGAAALAAKSRIDAAPTGHPAVGSDRPVAPGDGAPTAPEGEAPRG
jgi:hypothetical protein